MPISKDEIREIAEAVRDSWQVVDRHSEYFIDPKDHYDQHQRIDRMLDMFESSASIVWKTLLVFAVVGVVGLIIIGVKMRS